jgi:SagB-type dehydrogenase family enzyme
MPTAPRPRYNVDRADWVSGKHLEEPLVRMRSVLGVVLASVCLVGVAVAADDPEPIALPKPQTDGGKPLMQALKNRRTSREFSPRALPDQILSNLLWAAAGINRPGSGKRTAPSAMNWQEVDVYVFKADGVYRYDGKAHALQPVLAKDLRALTGKQAFVKDAPVNLVYVADYSKMGRASRADKKMYSAADTGFISQNVYLFCASEGLATVVRGWVDRPALAKAMKLRPEQKVILAQTVGWPKKGKQADE